MLRTMKYLLVFTGIFTASLNSQLVVAASDFTDRCANANVVRCFDFDSQTAAAKYIEQGQQPSSVPCENNGDCTKIVTNDSASGAGSLRFEIPSNSPPDSSGSFHFNFTPGVDNYSSGPFPIQFGEGDEFYVQWRQKFSPEFLQKFKVTDGQGGFKQIIVGEGDRAGAAPVYSCTELELVVNNGNQYGVPQMYHACGFFEGFYGSNNGDYTIQNVPPCQWRNGNPDPNDGLCIPYVANEWMTFQMHVKIGTWYKNDGNKMNDSTVELWVARENQQSKLALSHKTTNLRNTNPDAKYGKVWLTPFHTGKDRAEAHPTAYTWYDELIISKAKISDPGFSAGNQPPVPPSKPSITKQ